jgi:two-component system sensor histidine kinase EvgS
MVVAWRTAACALVFIGWLLCSLGARAQALHFPQPRLAMPLPLGQQVLSADERAFVAALPAIRVAVPTPPSRPYEEVGADGAVTGIHPEMLVYLAKAFGLKLAPVAMPSWSAALEGARNGQVDLIMTIGPTAERLRYLSFTLGATPLQGALFARARPPGAASSPATAAPADLAQARFAVEREFLANDHLRRQYPQASLLTVADTGEALAAVADGRADYYLGSLFEAIAWMEHRQVKGVELRQLMHYGSGHYHFAVRRDWARLATILNKGIASVRQTQNPPWMAPVQPLAASVSLPAPLALDPEQSALLLARPHWRVGAVRGLAMLNEVDERGLHSGVAAEYMEQVARRLGVSYEVLPFDNVAAMLDALRRGQLDLVPFLTRTAPREAEFAFSQPYVTMPYMIVARSDAPLYWSLDSLRGRRLALADQHPLRPLLAQRWPDIDIVTTANGNAAMDAVQRREADAAVEVKLFANLRINSDADNLLRAVAEVAELPASFHFATLKRQGEILPLVNRALADIPPAEHQRMLRRWVALDLQPGQAWRRWLPLGAVVLAALLLLAGATAWWARRLAREVRARRAGEAQLRDIGHTLPGVAFRHLLGPQQAVVDSFYSDGAQAFLGVALDPRQSLLANLAPRLKPDDVAQARQDLQRCLQGGERFKMTGAYQHPDGRERWLHAEAVLSRTPGGQDAVTGYVVDVSTERALQAGLAREARARNLLLASASHELRAPTHTLTLALQSLAGEVPAAAQAPAMAVAQDAARTLGQLLNDVLDAARFDAGELTLRPQDFDLHALLATLAQAFDAEARAKGLAFALQRSPDLPALVHGDPLRLKQLLTNLLSNAIKYTPQGRVALAVRQDGGTLVAEVDDTGIGISPAQRERLFNPYATLDDPAAPLAPQGSSGLGLVISQRLAALMGGELELVSASGRGTRVTLRLPLHGQAGAAGAPLTPQDLVLVCDDDPTSRMLLDHMLRARGLRVETVADGQAALARWRQGGVRALVTDLDMGGLGGMALMQQLRQDEARGTAPRTRVVVCSGSPVPDRSPGPVPWDRFITKPVHLALLLQALGLP